MAKAEDPKALVSDVTKPGQNPPSATSRPVITVHKGIMKDPMVSGKDDKPVAADKKITKTSERVLAPLNTETATAKTPKNPEPVSPAETEQPVATDTEVAAVPATDNPPSLAGGIAKAEKGIELKTDTGPSKEDIERREHIDELINSGEYFLPIGQITSRRNTKRFLAVFMILLIIGLIGAYLAVDAGLIQTDVKLPFEIL